MNELFDIAYKRYLDRIAESAKTGEQVYFIHDIETGIPTEVTKEEHERFLSVWEACKPKLDNNHKSGHIVFYGTGSNEEFSKQF